MKVDGAHVVFHRKLKTRHGEVEGVLLCKRTQDAPSDAGRWSLPGGKLKCGEKAEKGAQREVLEELEVPSTQLEAAFQNMKALCDVQLGGGKVVSFFHSLLTVDMDELQLNRDPLENKVEGQGLAWFTMAEARCLDMRGQDRDALIEYFKIVTW